MFSALPYRSKTYEQTTRRRSCNDSLVLHGIHEQVIAREISRPRVKTTHPQSPNGKEVPSL